MKKICIIYLIFVSSIWSTSSFAQKNIEFLGKLPYSQTLSNIWGYVDDQNNEYAIVGVGNGVSLVDVTNPAAPVEKFFFPGQSTIWREPKVWNKHAYIAEDNVSEGMMIIDMSGLPDTATAKFYTGNGLSSAHTVFIDEKGFAYLFGSNIGNEGAVVLDLADPDNPVEVGQYNGAYIHDGYVRGDTLWACEMYNGWFSVIDFRDKSNPIVLATHDTPKKFSHNCWLSDDSKTLYTTDEVDGAWVAAYDVSDLSNIKELSRYQRSPLEQPVPHNTYVVNDYLVTSYYTDGLTIVDATDPAIMIETGHYDTSPLSGKGMEGCWGVYPYLPSGNILATDMQEGLFIVKPTYVKACYLYGTITDSVSGAPVGNAKIEILTTEAINTSGLDGKYKTGWSEEGTFDVKISHPQFETKILNGVVLLRSLPNLLDVQLQSLASFSLTGNVKSVNSGNVLAGVQISIKNDDFDFLFTTDSLGNFSKSPYFAGTYNITIGKWGYKTLCIENVIVSAAQSQLNYEIREGLYDDFTFDYGWQVSGDAPRGVWERAKPQGTEYNGAMSNPGNDVGDDCSDFCMTTGNAGGSAGEDDIDDGTTILKSPIFDLSLMSSPVLSYSRWFYNGGGNGSTPNDSFMVSVTNGTDVQPLEVATVTTGSMSTWVQMTFNLKDYISLTNTMQIEVRANDAQPGHLSEAAFDYFRIQDTTVTSIEYENVASNKVVIQCNPNPTAIDFNVHYTFNKSIHSSQYHLVVHDIMGRTVYNQRIVEQKDIITLGKEFSPGLYLIRFLENGENLKTVKLIKN